MVVLESPYGSTGNATQGVASPSAFSLHGNLLAVSDDDAPLLACGDGSALEVIRTAFLRGFLSALSIWENNGNVVCHICCHVLHDKLIFILVSGDAQAEVITNPRDIDGLPGLT